MNNKKCLIKGGPELAVVLSDPRFAYLRVGGDCFKWYYWNGKNFMYSDHKKDLPDIDIMSAEEWGSDALSCMPKIIGYKTPIKLYGSVDAGTVYVKSQPSYNWYYIEGMNDRDQRMPKEIVETWEPVYEEIKPKLPVIAGYEGELNASGTIVKYGCQKFTKQEVLDLIILINNYRLKYNVELGVRTYNVTVEQIRAVWEVIK